MTTSALAASRNATVREFWLHDPTGYIWALETDRAGQVIAAAGPLVRADAEPLLLDYFLYKPTDVPWIVRHRLEFTRVESS